MTRTLAALAFLAALPGTAALAAENCTPPGRQAESYVSLMKLADEFGWRIDRMKVDDGCYELRVTNEWGDVLKVRIDPQTLDVVQGKVKRYGTTN